MKRALVIIASLAAVVAAAGPLDARLTFSQDGGKTWWGDCPTVVSGAVVRVRAAYTIADSWERRDVICASIMAAEKFASYTKKLPHGGYMQRDRVYWKTSRENGAYIWNLDVGGLAVGTHMFMLEIGYWRQDANGKSCERIADSQPFYLRVTSAK
jgi:hypothetical protein